MKLPLFICLIAFANAYVEIVVPDSKYGLNLNLFEEVLDAELCEKQMTYIVNNDTELMFAFLDSGIRTPRGILTGNTLDLGNYYQCLDINQEIPDSVVEGKYCLVEVPLNQNLNWTDLPAFPELPQWPDIPWPDIPLPELPQPNPSRRQRLSQNVVRGLKEYNVLKKGADTVFGGKVDTRISRVADDNPLADISLRVAVCIPKACTTQNALKTFVRDTNIGLKYEDKFCRLPKDKSWLVGDYVAVAIFSLIFVLAVLSTAYDINYQLYTDKDPKRINKLFQSFSVYTNTRRLVTYTPVPGALECLDGVRSFAMMWVILGHTFVTQLSSELMANPIDAVSWIMSLKSVWITAGPITVDTFFMLSGLLLVYTTNGKLSPMKLLKNLHLFYLNRLLRMFPILAAMVLIQATVLNWIADGPYWEVTMEHTHRCRVYWWTTLLYIQNFYNPSGMCLAHSWYLAIDIQLHILSPILLVWVLTGKRRLAWTALFGGLIAILTASTIFNFMKAFPSGPVIPSRPQDQGYYLTEYYVNTLTRASPFFVGLIFGYLLSIYKGQEIYISKISSAILWICAATIGCLTVYCSYPIMQLDWDNQFADNMINSFMRPGWAMAMGWLVFACVHGYGGPINWILSLRMWKVIGRLSYAMYITHYPLIFLVNAMPVAPVYFNAPFSMMKFVFDFGIAVFVSFVMTVMIDSPFSALIKLFLGGGIKKPQEKKEELSGGHIIENSEKTRI